MLLSSAKLKDIPIISLSTGERVGLSLSPVIDWMSLKIPALRCAGGNDNDLLLITKDIRQYDGQVFLINSEDELVLSSEVIRLQPLLEADFKLIGAQVKTESGLKVGRVSDYTFDLKTLEIQQLYVKQPLIKNIMNSNLVVHRLQIAEVTPPVIVIRDATTKEPLTAARPIPVK